MSVSDKKNPLYNASHVNIDTKSLGLSLISVFICTLYESAQKYNALTHSDTCTIASSCWGVLDTILQDKVMSMTCWRHRESLLAELDTGCTYIQIFIQLEIHINSFFRSAKTIPIPTCMGSCGHDRMINWIYSYLCNQCLPLRTLRFPQSIKVDRHDKTEILLKVVLNTNFPGVLTVYFFKAESVHVIDRYKIALIWKCNSYINILK